MAMEFYQVAAAVSIWVRGILGKLQLISDTICSVRFKGFCYSGI
jgi:hypothetical protein